VTSSFGEIAKLQWTGSNFPGRQAVGGCWDLQWFHGRFMAVSGFMAVNQIWCMMYDVSPLYWDLLFHPLRITMTIWVCLKIVYLDMGLSENSVSGWWF